MQPFALLEKKRLLPVARRAVSTTLAWSLAGGLAASTAALARVPRPFQEAWDAVQAQILVEDSERKIQGLKNDLEPVEAALGTDAYDWSRGVALVILVDASGSGATAPYCSGARVGKSLFLTNAHCDQGCDYMRFTLGAERDAPADKRMTFRCSQLVRKSLTYDYALYTAEPESLLPGPSVSEFPPLTLARGPLTDGMPLVVPGHPYRGTKMLDRSDECIVASAAVVHTASGRDTFTHLCDTEGGSSGSPVLDRATGNVVGLHWGGEDKQANFAIPIDLILKDLEAHITTDLLDELTIVD